MDEEREFILTGDIKHPGKVRVRAKDAKEALKKAAAGDFEVFDECGKPLAFDFDGDADHIQDVTGD